MDNHFDAIVVGGGVIGSLTARRLGRAGRTVLLLESGALGRQSSAAAAGMLGAQLEMDEPGPLYRLGIESRRLFARLSEELLAETGIDIELTTNGILRIAATSEEEAELKAALAWQKAAGQRGEWVDGRNVARLEPCLAQPSGALFLPDDGNVSAPRLAEAAAAAAARVSAVHEGEAVLSVVAQGLHVLVRTNRGLYSADSAIVAAGAWSDQMLEARDRFGVKPVKGQMFAIRPKPGVRLQHTVFRHGAVYLVPKRDGSIVVGATMEPEAGYRREVTVDALQRLSSALREVAPGLMDAQFERAWTGLRPMAGVGRPVIGPLPEEPRVILATGHLRNGVLLAPITAEIVASYVEGGGVAADWSALAPAARENVALGPAV